MILDLFAGPGGWSQGLKLLGLEDFGLELDDRACRTRYAAGHATWETDVSTVDPAMFLDCGVQGLIASPPCQDFSAAGGRSGLVGLRGKLVMEVLRWASALEPAWIACEQVPPVLPVWRAFARELEQWGYKTWTGLMNTADYGVPQERKRAILMAARHDFDPPAPTHAEHPGVGDFFAAPKKPWVTMAEGLGWVGSVNTGRDWKPGGSREDAQRFDTKDRPAPTVITLAGRQWQLRAGTHRPTAPRDPMTKPAPTLAFGHDAAEWVWERPATTVTCEARMWPPGHKINADDVRRLGDDAYARYGDRAGTEAIRLEPAQAAVLQGFPADYPFQGSRTRVFEQIGNAVPPPLAAAIVGCLAGVADSYRM